MPEYKYRDLKPTPEAEEVYRRWLRFHLFAVENSGAFQSTNLRSRYLESTELAARYTEFLDTLNAMRRLEEIRRAGDVRDPPPAADY